MIEETFGPHYEAETLIIENETFKCTELGRPAIRLIWPPAESIAKCGAIIRNCVFEPGTQEWAFPIEVINGWHVVIENCNIVSGPTGKLKVGINLMGQTMNTRISNLTCTHADIGVRISDECEGTKIYGTEILGAVIAIVAATPQGEAGLWVSDSHVSASRCGIAMEHRHQFHLHNLLIYRYGSQSPDWSGISIGPGCWNGRVQDVDVCTFGAGGQVIYEEPGLNTVIRDVREIVER